MPQVRAFPNSQTTPAHSSTLQEALSTFQWAEAWGGSVVEGPACTRPSADPRTKWKMALDNVLDTRRVWDSYQETQRCIQMGEQQYPSWEEGVHKEGPAPGSLRINSCGVEGCGTGGIGVTILLHTNCHWADGLTLPAPRSPTLCASNQVMH